MLKCCIRLSVLLIFFFFIFFLSIHRSGWGFRFKQGATTILKNSAACTVSSSSITMETENSSGLPWELTLRPCTHATVLTDSMALLQKVEWKVQAGMRQCLTTTSCHSSHRFCGVASKGRLRSPDWHVSMFDDHLVKLQALVYDILPSTTAVFS